MRKVIFLDYDGVLTSEPFTRQCIFEYRKESLFGMDWVAPECLKALKHVVDRTEAEIVFSSSWRDILNEERLKRLWKETPLPGVFVGTTPLWVMEKDRAILKYLDLHPDIDRYVVLDDDPLKVPNLIKTDTYTGLTMQKAEEAIMKMNQQ